MKRIGILSDTHGYLEDIDLVLRLQQTKKLICGFMLVIMVMMHAMQEHTDIPVYAVRGNNDRVQPLEPREQLIPLEDTYIYMTHGQRGIII